MRSVNIENTERRGMLLQRASYCSRRRKSFRSRLGSTSPQCGRKRRPTSRSGGLIERSHAGREFATALHFDSQVAGSISSGSASTQITPIDQSSTHYPLGPTKRHRRWYIFHAKIGFLQPKRPDEPVKVTLQVARKQGQGHQSSALRDSQMCRYHSEI